MNPLLQLILDDSGGISAWKNIDYVDLTVDMGGVTLSLKPRGKTKRRVVDEKLSFRMLVQPLEDPFSPLVYFFDYPSPGLTGVYCPHHVYIMDSNKNIVKERKHPRKAFLSGWGKFRRNIFWDDLDMLFFMAYANYYYVLTPYLFTFPGVTTRELEPEDKLPPSWYVNQDGPLNGMAFPAGEHLPEQQFRVLEATFPDSINTHTTVEKFYIGTKGDLKNKIIMRSYHLELSPGGKLQFSHYQSDYRKPENHTLTQPWTRRVFLNPDSPGYMRLFHRRNPLALHGRGISFKLYDQSGNLLAD